MKEPHSWKAAERSSVPGWFLHTSAFECAPTIYEDTQCYILSHIKGCFIPAKSQSSPDRHVSGLNFISGCGLAFKASWSRTTLPPL